MIVYTKSGGYGAQNTAEARKTIDSLPSGSRDKVILLGLLYDYECLRRVIDGGQFVFRHEDGSEVRRIKFQ